MKKNPNPLIDLTNKQFDYWKVLKRAPNRNETIYWLCQCKCGTLKEIQGTYLRKNPNAACKNCNVKIKKKQICKNNPLKDLTNKQFGNWIVIKRANNRYGGKTYWLCKCKCGIEKEVSAQILQNNNSKSCSKCGAIKRGINSRKHGYCISYKKTPEYHIWNSMKNRCNNPNTINYKLYGGRGIKICKEWENSFEVFLKDMGEKPTKTSSIDRIDVNKGYYKENCHWIEKKMQAKNTRKNPLINGVRICINDLAKKINKCRFYVSKKLKEGFTVEEITNMDLPPYKNY